MSNAIGSKVNPVRGRTLKMSVVRLWRPVSNGVNLNRGSLRIFFSFDIKLITPIKRAVIRPAQTESSKTAAHGEAKVNNIRAATTLTKERRIVEKSIFLVIAQAKAKIIIMTNKAKW